MKNKKINIGLLIVALIVWGYILYSLFSGDSGNEIIHSSPVAEMNKSSSQKQDTTQFKIIADYPDPFLKGGFKGFTRNYYPTPGKKTHKKPPITHNRKIPDRTIWPKISYHGMFSDSEGNNKIGYFYVDNRDVMLREGESYKDLCPVKIFRDSVILTFEKSTKVIYRE